MTYVEFEMQQKAAQQEIANLMVRSNRMSLIRLLVALAIAVSGLAGFLESNILFWGVAIVGLLMFFFLVYKHQRIEEMLRYYDRKEKVIQRYLNRFDHQWQDFSAVGEEFASEDFPQGYDLDILGRGSLYQFLSVAHTAFGQKKLAQYLKEPPNVETMIKRQEAVQELLRDPGWVLEFEALSSHEQHKGRFNHQPAIDRLLIYSEQTPIPKEIASVKLLAWGLPLLTFIALVLAVFKVIAPVYFVVGVVMQLTISMLGYGKASGQLEPLYGLEKHIGAYSQLFDHIEQKDFQSDYLQQLQQKINQQDGAKVAMKHLRFLGEAANLRFNVILYLLLSGLVMWNSQCLLGVYWWRRRYGQNLRNWLEAVGEFEALMSLSVIGLVKEQWCFPQLLDSHEPQFNMEQVYHPLLAEKKAVANSIALKQQMCIITGSNMSGKTTFLRSIGANLVLAYAGAPVCAQQMSCSVMGLFTSMRVHDDVNKGISTFYAELLRVKMMVEYSQQHQPMLVLIDEIFKGTNSADRIVGAQMVIRHLSKPWIIGMVSTHDFELCQLMDAPEIHGVNYHFAEYYVDNEIAFDYKMRQGRCQTTNARHLMAMVGLWDREEGKETITKKIRFIDAHKK